MLLDDRILTATIIFSSLVHGAIFVQRIHTTNANQEKMQQKIEVSYVRTEKEVVPADTRLLPPKRESPAKLPSQALFKSSSPPQFYEENATDLGARSEMRALVRPLMPKGTEFAKPVFSKPDFAISKRKVTMPVIIQPDSDKINNPVYINYYQFVREKIRKSAYENYVHTEQGEVYLSFSVRNDGTLKGVNLVEEKSSGNEYLRQTALVSIKDAAPFPRFPRELDYPQLTFNVIISFEIE